MMEQREIDPVDNMFDKAYERRDIASASKRGDLPFAAIPFHWEFEEFCKRNSISCHFDFVSGEYIICPKIKENVLTNTLQNNHD